jgi:G3E family GTPase
MIRQDTPPKSPTRPVPRFIMVGGFLGAGKTTTILRLAQYWQRHGHRPGLITNDQAEGLVDTALLEELNLPVREIVGGCFCCRSETLVQALEALERGEENAQPRQAGRGLNIPSAKAKDEKPSTSDGGAGDGGPAGIRPNVFVAEPVGICTDLVATVTLPLEKIYRKGFVMAPYAVLVDPFRAEQVLGVGKEAGMAGTAGMGLAGPAGEKRFSRKSEKTLAAKERVAALVGVALSKGGEPAKALTKAEAREIADIQAEMEEVMARIGAGTTVAGSGPQGISPAATVGHLAGRFSDDVNYIYRKQLEEAEIIVINKVDLMPEERRARLRSKLAVDFPQARLLEIGSREGTNLEPLFQALTTETGATRRVMEVDYARYGVGEARLGWVNGRYEVKLRGSSEEVPEPASVTSGKSPVSPSRFDADAWLMGLAQSVHQRLRKHGVEIAHLKLTFGERAALGAVQLVRTEAKPEFTQKIGHPVWGGQLRVNLRAEADPDRLMAAVSGALVQAVERVPGLELPLSFSQHLRPGQPQPIHRVTTLTRH